MPLDRLKSVREIVIFKTLHDLGKGTPRNVVDIFNVCPKSIGEESSGKAIFPPLSGFRLRGVQGWNGSRLASMAESPR